MGSPLRKLILVKLAQNSDDDGWSWWSQRRIAEECETTRQTVNEHIKALRGMGLIQVIERRREDGGRRSNKYRVLVPWSNEEVSGKATGEAQPADEGDVGQADRESSSKESSKGKNPPTPLGQRRFRVESNTTPGKTYIADLGNDSCTCQARRGCKHLTEAEEFEDAAAVARSKELRDALWDVLVEIDGPPVQRKEAERGQVVSDVAEMLANDGIKGTPERWTEEVRARHAALVKAWGQERVTLHSFVTNWHLAGKLVRGDQDNGGEQLSYTTD